MPAPPLDLARQQRLHVVGVGGPGMSAIALALAQMGHRVSGSDLRERPVLDRLRAAGVVVHVGHNRAYVHGCDAVTSSTAVPADLNELDEARRLGLPVLSRAGMLASICACARSLGVAGTHGKTTTSSMLMLILAEAGLRPSFVIGGDVTDMGTGAQWTGGEWFVVEADESDGTHLELPLHGTILTNVETDHLDHYGSFECIVAGFDRYLRQVAGPKVVCGDDPVAARLAAEHGAITYGTSKGVDVPRGRRARHPRHADVRDRTGGRTSRRHRLAVARASQRAQRRRGVGDGGRDRCRSRRWRRTRSPSSAVSPAGSTSAVRMGVRRSSTTTPTFRRRSRPSSTRPATATTVGAASWPSSSRTGTTAWPRSRPTTATRSVTPTSWS